MLEEVQIEKILIEVSEKAIWSWEYNYGNAYIWPYTGTEK
jgi:hypothetical protein